MSIGGGPGSAQQKHPEIAGVFCEAAEAVDDAVRHAHGGRGVSRYLCMGGCAGERGGAPACKKERAGGLCATLAPSATVEVGQRAREGPEQHAAPGHAAA